MENRDLIKAAILLFLYLVGVPALAVFLRGKRVRQRVVFFLICFMTISGLLNPAEWGFTLAYEPEYRGHARGYHFFFNEILALGLILALARERKESFRWLPPGIFLYLAYCSLSLISIVNAPMPHYVWMAAFKAFKVIVIFVACYNYMRSEEDVRFFLGTMSFTMIWEMLVVLKMKYLEGVYQVWGTFEHQNALSMYSSMIGMVLLAVAAGTKERFSNLYIAGFIATAVVTECTLSRAGLVVFIAGSGAVMLMSLIDRPTRRRFAVIGLLAMVGSVGMLFAANTIVKRFNEKYNRDSNETRKMLNEASRQMLRDYPLGIGWNNFGHTINRPYHYGDVIDKWFLKFGEKIDYKHRKGIVESHYYLLLAETGYQALISYLVFIVAFLWWNFRAAWGVFRGHFLGSVSLGIAIGCGSNYLQSFVERVLTQPRNLMLWMLLLGLTARIETWRRMAKNRPEFSPSQPRSPRQKTQRRREPAFAS